ncbi:MAG: M56 family metallopeptidase [Clostridiales Family XIII bacterium]|jgi:beta-lactamase regulating signal transducer with metallopeptidase domain|nr:M56 family metallopeptidase [Clostridiales Family XIII bacterium]
MAELLKTVVTMTIAGSVLAAALFALKPLIKNRLPKAAQYYLWLVVIVALLAPFSRFVALPVDSPVKIADAVDYYLATNGEVYERVKPYEAVDADGYVGIPEEYQATVDSLMRPVWAQELLDWCRLLYILGAALCFGYFVLTYIWFYARLKRRNVPADVKCAVPVYRNALADTPMLLGLFRPAIILPDREYTEAQLQAVLAHELAHLRRKDMLVRWAAALACSVHWFNPLVWLVRREIDRACELACDEAVVSGLDTDGKRTYGETLLAIAAKPAFGRAVRLAMCEEKRDLKERLGAIRNGRKRGMFAVIASATLLIALAACAVGLGAGNSANNNLIEMEAIETKHLAHSDDPQLLDTEYYTLQVKWGDIIYSSYSENPDDGEVSSKLLGKHIGYAWDSEHRYKYKIFEYKGYAPEEYIVVYYDIIMSSYMLYRADGGPHPEAFEYERVIPDDIWIEAEDSSTPDSILTRWLTAYLNRIKSLPQDHEQAFEDFKITGVETADVKGDWLLGGVTFDIKPYGDPAASPWNSGNGDIGADDKSGWIVGKYQEIVLLHDTSDDTWHCKGYGTGGYDLNEYVDMPLGVTLADAAMYRRAALDAITGTFVFDESGVNFSVPSGLVPKPVKLAVEVGDADEAAGDAGFMVLTGWSVDGNEIKSGTTYSVPLWNLGGAGAHLAVMFEDGETIYYSPLYSDWLGFMDGAQVAE